MKKSTLVPLLLSGAALTLMACAAWSQGPMAPEPLQQKIQALQKASAENEQQLHTYQWLETTTVSVNGSPKPPRQSICRYTPYGTVSKTPLGPQSEPPRPSGGPLKRHVMEQKIQEVQEDIAQVHRLVATYLPLNREALLEAFQTHRVDFEHGGDQGNSIVIHDFAKQGDTLSFDLNAATMQLRGIGVRSYFESPSDVLTVDVQFAVLPDGTHYPSVTTINAPGKHISITTVQSDFSKAVQ